MNETFSLKEHRLSFNRDSMEFEIYHRENPNTRLAFAALNGPPIELAVNVLEDTISLVPLENPLEQHKVVQIEINAASNFGLDSLGMGGVGISDLRDQFRTVHWFDLKRCRLSFQILNADARFSEMQMVAEALMGPENVDEFYLRTERINPKIPE